jgi:predicted DNA-binding protein
MSKMIAIRLHDEMLSQVDQERKRTGLTRAAAVKEALQLWVEKRQYDEAVRRDQEGYKRHPIGSATADHDQGPGRAPLRSRLCRADLS